jgi:hypothetical protein
MSGAPSFREAVPHVTIRSGFAVLRWKEGDGEAMPLNVLRML